MRSVCVYCGSSGNAAEVYFEAARRTGQTLVERGLSLVFGGSRSGLMGVLADTVLAGGGRAVGVIPGTLVEKEVAHSGLSELHVVESMHDRKALMSDLADAFIALPGAFGTLDELFETLTWGQLQFHRKPIGLLNVDGFYDALLGFLERSERDGFLHPAHRAMITVGTDPAGLLDRMACYEPPDAGKWWLRNK